jgi:CheY-like chemotaxis protein
MNDAGREVRRVHILLIEDNAADVILLRRALASAQVDCELTVLEDGAEALSFVQSLEADRGIDAPDLAVLDLNLPKNDGVEVLQAMRATHTFSRVPVAIVTSSASPRERARVEQYGIGRYITKPSDLDEFLSIGLMLKQLLMETA